MTPWIFFCDHATNYIPPELTNLGLPASELERHIAWDIGAAAVTAILAEVFSVPAVFSSVSRLVIDCNRHLHAGDLIPEVSDGTPIPGKWHIYPEMAAAGLWTTPTDLAKFGIETALSKQGKANHVLDQATTHEMLKPQIEQVGLGFFLGQYKNPEEFGHEGDDAGFQALLIMFADSGKGVAVMANSENGVTVANQVIQSVAKEYGWNYTPDPPAAAALLMLVANIKGPRAAITRYEELKKAGSSSPYTLDENTLIQLGYQFLSGGQTDWAIQTFKLEVQDYPKNWNSYDSLGEAYLKAGQKDLSIENYQKSVELNPQNQNGIDALKKIQGQK